MASLTYRELARRCPAYVKDLGFTHIELLPDGAPVRRLVGLPGARASSRRPPGFGPPDDFSYLVDACTRPASA